MFGLDRGTQPQIKIGINHEEVDLDQLARLDSIANFAFDPSETDSTLLVEKRDQIAQYADDARLLIKFESGGLAVLSAGEIRRELEEDFVSTSRLHDNFFVVDDVNPDQKKAILEERRNKELLRYDNLPEKFAAEHGIGVLANEDVVVYLENIKYLAPPVQKTVAQYHQMFDLKSRRERYGQSGEDSLFALLEEWNYAGGIVFIGRSSL